MLPEPGGEATAPGLLDPDNAPLPGDRHGLLDGNPSFAVRPVLDDELAAFRDRSSAISYLGERVEC
ncbi:MAG: hypothetical protein GY842_03230 [bacterium]|nr:hypothetical protein [bacterium]